jgi:Uma2 family endonuclease
MTAALQPKKIYSLEEYFELERNSEEKYEFWDGNVWSMSGNQIAHNQISTNLGVDLSGKLRTNGCKSYFSEMRVKVPAYPPYRYPDFSAVCGELVTEKIGGVDVLLNPQIIIEILSDSTEAFDRGDKFSYYKSIPSFIEYLLIAQHRPHVSHFVKHGDGFWANFEYNDLSDSITLGSTAVTIDLASIYFDVVFPEIEPNLSLSETVQSTV